ncbi:adhesion G-protein coupled receptor D1-like [Anneissia japonica]|uniref:adhesion G-protein coupled receptor D1-like n=1 Tax=Anneissia japonica TaxID=1529436 RepID=UPI001425B858|nr:adhesion G-protein coupled receptor D1-like [Anneissia japonica]
MYVYCDDGLWFVGEERAVMLNISSGCVPPEITDRTCGLELDSKQTDSPNVEELTTEQPNQMTDATCTSTPQSLDNTTRNIYDIETRSTSRRQRETEGTNPEKEGTGTPQSLTNITRDMYDIGTRSTSQRNMETKGTNPEKEENIIIETNDIEKRIIRTLFEGNNTSEIGTGISRDFAYSIHNNKTTELNIDGEYGIATIKLKVNSKQTDGYYISVATMFSVVIDIEGKLLNTTVISCGVYYVIAERAPYRISTVEIHISFPREPTFLDAKNNNLRTEKRCQYIDETLLEWLDVGCRGSDDNTCSCSHTTNFAILMKIDECYIEKKYAKILNILTYTCLSVSSGCLTVVVFTTVFLRELNKSIRFIIIRNMSIGLLIVNALVGFASLMADIKILCGVVTAGLHYSLLAVFCWMSIYTTDMFMKVVNTFADHDGRLRFYRLLGWGAPLVIVGATVAVTREDYASDKCWLNTENLATLALIIPAGLSTMVNIMQLTKVTYVTYRKVVTSCKSTNVEEQRNLVCRVMMLLPVVGVTWLFGLASSAICSIATEFIFVFLNSSLGAIVWLTQIRFSSEAQTAWKKCKERKIHNTVSVLTEEQKSGSL